MKDIYLPSFKQISVKESRITEVWNWILIVSRKLCYPTYMFRYSEIIGLVVFDDSSISGITNSSSNKLLTHDRRKKKMLVNNPKKWAHNTSN